MIMNEKKYLPVLVSIMLVIKRVTISTSISNNKGIIWGGMTLWKVLLGLGGSDFNNKHNEGFLIYSNQSMIISY